MQIAMIKNLKYLREKYNISQKALGEIIQVSQQSINKYENHNVEPDIKTLIEIANYFNTSVDYLIGNTEIDHIIEPIQNYDLNEDEALLINEYRKLNAQEKDSIKLIISNYNKKS